MHILRTMLFLYLSILCLYGQDVKTCSFKNEKTSLYPNGNIKIAQLQKPCTVQGYQLPSETVITLAESGKLEEIASKKSIYLKGYKFLPRKGYCSILFKEDGGIDFSSGNYMISAYGVRLTDIKKFYGNGSPKSATLAAPATLNWLWLIEGVNVEFYRNGHLLSIEYSFTDFKPYYGVSVGKNIRLGNYNTQKAYFHKNGAIAKIELDEERCYIQGALGPDPEEHKNCIMYFSTKGVRLKHNDNSDNDFGLTGSEAREYYEEEDASAVSSERFH
jgi:hypothetical protein